MKNDALKPVQGNLILGPRFLTTKHYVKCTYGITPTTMQAAQNTLTTESGESYLTQYALKTTMLGDFLCVYSVLLYALIGALVAATGGFGAVALGAVIGGAMLGGGIAMAQNTLICGAFGSMFRIWIMPKTNVIINNGISSQHPVLSNSYMCCNIFGGTITYLPKVTNWWQALLVTVSNTLTLAVFRCIMVGAAAFTFVSLTVLAAVDLGAKYIGSTTFMKILAPLVNLAIKIEYIQENITPNILANWALTFTKGGMVVRAGVAATEVIQATYVREGDRPLTDSIGEGMQFYERNIEASADALIKGKLTQEQALCLLAAATPLSDTMAPNKGNNEISKSTLEPNTKENTNIDSIDTTATEKDAIANEDNVKETSQKENNNSLQNNKAAFEQVKLEIDKVKAEIKKMEALDDNAFNQDDYNALLDKHEQLFQELGKIKRSIENDMMQLQGNTMGLYEGSSNGIPEPMPIMDTPEPVKVKIAIDPVEVAKEDGLPFEDTVQTPANGNKPYASLFVYVSGVAINGFRRLAAHTGLIIYKHGKNTPEVFDLEVKKDPVTEERITNDQGRWLSDVEQDPHIEIPKIGNVMKRIYEIVIDENQYNNLQNRKTAIVDKVHNAPFGENVEAKENNCASLVTDLLRAADIEVPFEIGRTKVSVPPNRIGIERSVVPPFKDWLDNMVTEGKAKRRNQDQIADWLKSTLNY